MTEQELKIIELEFIGNLKQKYALALTAEIRRMKDDLAYQQIENSHLIIALGDNEREIKRKDDIIAKLKDIVKREYIRYCWYPHIDDVEPTPAWKNSDLKKEIDQLEGQ